MWSRLAFVGAFLFLLADGTVAIAADPPGRVGRLSLVEGTVSLRSPQPVDANNAADNAAPELKDEWAPATLNYPVTSGNSLWTESGAKAELQVGPAEVRLNEQTELEVLRLDDRSVDLALHQGTANIHIGDAIPGGLLIDTPRGAVTLTQPGSYRIDVDTGGDNPADTVQVTAFDGDAKVSVETPDKTDTHTVKRGQSLKLAGEPVQIALADARATAFDDWARSRDPRAIAAARSQAATPTVSPAVGPQTVSPVSPQMTGYQDLAPYGSWEPAPSYGTVWYPATVTPDWAPYRYGHWAYVAPWGWTWIDDAPWGFTPFHYGRWVRVGPRWAWWPGHRTVRPVYAPALVAFVGGNGWSVAITSGRARPVGWVPLAPYEVYRPHYRTSATYVRNVNITTVNKTVINNITVNNNTEINRFTNRNAITAVSADNFARGRKVNEAKIDVSRKEIERAKVTTDVRAIKPAAVAVKTDQPRPAVRKDDARQNERRAPNPAITSRDQDRSRDRSQERNQPREQHREATPRPAQKPAEKPAQQAAPAAAPQQQHDAQEHQQRERAAQEQRRQRDDAQGQQRREQQEQQQRSEQQQRQRDQARDQAQEQQRQRDQAEQQQRREQQEQRQRRERPEQRSERQNQPQQDQQRQVQEQQRRQHMEAQQRQQAEQQQRQAQDQQQRAQHDQQRRQQAEQHQRQQAEAQQRQAQDQQRRAQAEQQQRQQAEQQQRAQADQQRQQRDQAQQQQRQQQEQAREEQRRRSPDNRPEGKRDRAG